MTKALPGVPALPRQFPPGTQGTARPLQLPGRLGVRPPLMPQLLPHPGIAAPAPGSNCRGLRPPGLHPGPPGCPRGPSSCPQLPPRPGPAGGAAAAAGCGGAGDGAGGAAPPAAGVRGPRARHGEEPRGGRGSRRAPLTVTAMAVTAAHAQAVPACPQMSPSPQGAAARGAGAAAPPVGTRHGHGGDTAQRPGHRAAMARPWDGTRARHTARRRVRGTQRFHLCAHTPA